jgi:hypothetical protein
MTNQHTRLGCVSSSQSLEALLSIVKVRYHKRKITYQTWGLSLLLAPALLLPFLLLMLQQSLSFLRVEVVVEQLLPVAVRLRLALPSRKGKGKKYMKKKLIYSSRHA